MYKKKQITLAIVTKKRPKKLQRLLCSILVQKTKPVQIIIVDNDLQKSAKKISIHYAQYLPIKYFTEVKQGVPFARNTALRNVKTKYLAFVDDDCVIDKNWIVNAEKIINKFKNISYFIGTSNLLNFGSKVAVAQHIHQKYWFIDKLESGVITSPFNVDTKNIIFKVSDLKKNKLTFDTNISIGWFDSADTDMGFAMKSKDMIGIYGNCLKIWHEETTSVKYFLTKGFYRGKLAKILANKWSLKNEFVYLPYLNWKTYLKSVKGWSREYNKYFSISKNKNIFSFILIKIYERVFLSGYVSRRN